MRYLSIPFCVFFFLCVCVCVEKKLKSSLVSKVFAGLLFCLGALGRKSCSI